MIPSIDRKEWFELVTGSSDPGITSPLFKIKVSILRRKVIRKVLTPEQAVKELMKDCEKHYVFYRQDLHKIFGKKKEENIHHL